MGKTNNGKWDTCALLGMRVGRTLRWLPACEGLAARGTHNNMQIVHTWNYAYQSLLSWLMHVGGREEEGCTRRGASVGCTRPDQEYINKSV